MTHHFTTAFPSYLKFIERNHLHVSICPEVVVLFKKISPLKIVKEENMDP